LLKSRFILEIVSDGKVLLIRHPFIDENKQNYTGKTGGA